VGPRYVVINRRLDNTCLSQIGVPVAWMLTSNGKTETITYFLHWVKDASPTVQPAVIMTDCDQAQIAAIQAVYPQSQTLLCMWHVLHVMRSHLSTKAYPVLWDNVKAWVKTEDPAEFSQLKDKIFNDPSTPQSFIDYLTNQWTKPPERVDLWSRVVRRGRSIFKEGDTNMLIKA
jgi:MULE transposase domain